MGRTNNTNGSNIQVQKLQKHINIVQLIYEYTQAYKTCFLKRWTFFLIDMWMMVFESRGNDFSIFFRSNDVDLNVLLDEIKLNDEVANF